MFNIPYYYPGFGVSPQLFNPGANGRGGSHPREQITAPRTYPIVYNITAYGMANMPRQVIGPSNPITVNAISNPPSISNLQILGVMKK